MTKKSNPLSLLVIQTVLTALLCALWPVDPAQHERLYIVYGSLVSGLQFALLFFVWWRVFTKKKIAPSVIAVVIKYALLGLSFWYLSPLNWSEIKALTVGVMTNPVAIILFAVIKSRKMRLENQSEDARKIERKDD